MFQNLNIIIEKEKIAQIRLQRQMFCQPLYSPYKNSVGQIPHAILY